MGTSYTVHSDMYSTVRVRDVIIVAYMVVDSKTYYRSKTIPVLAAFPLFAESACCQVARSPGCHVGYATGMEGGQRMQPASLS
jgi:hypothetical protein